MNKRNFQQDNVTIYKRKMNYSTIRFFRQSFKEMIRFRFALSNFVKVNLANKYRRSALGYLWSLLNPLLNMLITSFVFSLVFKLPIQEYGVYIFSGMMPWLFISNGIVGGSMSLVYSEGFMKKIYVPKIFFPVSFLSTELINFILNIISLFLLVLLVGGKVGMSFFLLPFAILILTIYILGMILIFSVLTIYFRDLFNILQVLFTGLMYSVPIVYKLEFIPLEYQWLFQLNPLYYFIKLFQTIIFETKGPTIEEWIMAAAISFLTLIFGLIVFERKEQDLIFRL